MGIFVEGIRASCYEEGGGIVTPSINSLLFNNQIRVCKYEVGGLLLT